MKLKPIILHSDAAIIYDRLMQKVLKLPNGCWEWTGAKGHKGYGYFTSARTKYIVSRWLWTYLNGSIPDGMFVCHTCDNPPCVNLEHLFLGTNSDNQLDSSRKGRRGERKWNPRRGEDCPTSHLTKEKIAEIITKLANGESYRSIGRFYHIVSGHVAQIKRGDAWGWYSKTLPNWELAHYRRGHGKSARIELPEARLKPYEKLFEKEGDVR